jgi:hypothetical protein
MLPQSLSSALAMPTELVVAAVPQAQAQVQLQAQLQAQAQAQLQTQALAQPAPQPDPASSGMVVPLVRSASAPVGMLSGLPQRVVEAAEACGDALIEMQVPHDVI